MTATNHTLTGIIVGLSLHQPYLAIPLSFILHFVLDSLPHFGEDDHRSTRFKVILAIDMFIAATILMIILLLRPEYWLLAIICGITCASPDLMWLPRWLQELNNKQPKALNMLQIFHARIQIYEKSYNYPYEIFWFIGCSYILVKIF